MKVILISGKAQHGKDTTAGFLSIILEALGNRVLVTHYGDLVKYICKTFFDWDGQKDEAGRSLLQRVGTDVIRRQDEDYWAQFVVQVLKFFDGEWDFVIIPDCRFPNELNLPREAGFDTVHIRVVRPDFDNGLTPEQQAHPSENSLDDVDPTVRLMNSGSLSDLRKLIGWHVLSGLGTWFAPRGTSGDQGRRGDPGVCPLCKNPEGLYRFPDGHWRCVFCGWEDAPQ